MENTTQPLTLTLNDLDALRAVVDLAAKRGAFQGPELSTVGAIYDKLVAFLDAVVAQQDTESDTDTESIEDTTEPMQGV